MIKLANNAKKLAFIVIFVCVARVIFVIASSHSK